MNGRLFKTQVAVESSPRYSRGNVDAHRRPARIDRHRGRRVRPMAASASASAGEAVSPTENDEFDPNGGRAACEQAGVLGQPLRASS